MINQSSDGDIIAGVARLTGWYPVRGSSSKGGKDALKLMIRLFRETRLAGHIMDGPNGLMEKVKSGTIRLTLDANAAIVPFYIATDRFCFFNSCEIGDILYFLCQT